MEMKIDGNLSVHQRTSRFRSDNENNTDERSAADTDRANEIFPAENEDEDTEATV
ncbi:hypothetical protein T12_977 [Trichinella patagoniensis]|uniref:Uncharacterized protein n=1 Tax=Trichinella patagoniensis TaxID=990121 RepID=A0A0V0Z142_9BILA|nr:hypothetical protein T12_977 [Trichinella patagoniensis]